MRALNLYRGAGGWEVGLRAFPDLKVDGVEIMPEANATAAAAGFATVAEDVWELDARTVPAGYYAGLIASPPCQSFSVSGKGTGRRDLAVIDCAVTMHAWESLDELKLLAHRLGDERSAHVLMPLHYAHVLRPRWILLEQVPTVRPVWEATAVQLREMGYQVWTGVVNAEQYGVPQTRRRAVLVASLDRDVHAPAATHSRYYPRTPTRLDPAVLPWVSMAEAPTRIDPSVDVSASVMISNYGTGGDPGGGGGGSGAGPPPAPGPTVTTHVDRNFWGSQRPATVIQGDPRLAAPGHRCMTPDCHPDREPESMLTKAVRVSVTEAAILQGFPADHPWQGTKTKQYQQVGNAIPPPLARALADVVLGDGERGDV